MSPSVNIPAPTRMESPIMKGRLLPYFDVKSYRGSHDGLHDKTREGTRRSILKRSEIFCETQLKKVGCAF
jgi:hypothetical protein